MKISILLKREPFKEIFEKTMISFLRDFTSKPHLVKWRNKSIFNKILDSDQQWYCNPLINSVFVKNVNPKVFNSINGEYLINTLRPWRSIFQRLYLFLSEYKFTSLLLSTYIINISPKIEDAKNKLIIGGNTKIRLIDIYNKNVYVILKEGFDRKFIDKEIYVRKKFKYLPIPKIINFDTNNLWYSEEYVFGYSPNRLETKRGKKILHDIVKYVHILLNESKKKVIVSEYVQSLNDRIIKGINKIYYLDKKVKKRIKYIISIIISNLEEHSDLELYMAYCHGDFHQGNILTNGKKHWILDWENSGNKQIIYDLLILLLESRIELGFSDRFLNLINNKFDDFQLELISDWPGIKWDNKILKKIYLNIFLLEDLIFYIDENNNQLFYEDSNVLNARSKELEKIVDNII